MYVALIFAVLRRDIYTAAVVHLLCCGRLLGMMTLYLFFPPLPPPCSLRPLELVANADRPLVGMQSLDNARDVTVCRNCLGFAGDVISQVTCKHTHACNGCFATLLVFRGRAFRSILWFACSVGAMPAGNMRKMFQSWVL